MSRRVEDAIAQLEVLGRRLSGHELQMLLLAIELLRPSKSALSMRRSRAKEKPPPRSQVNEEANANGSHASSQVNADVNGEANSHALSTISDGEKDPEKQGETRTRSESSASLLLLDQHHMNGSASARAGENVGSHVNGSHATVPRETKRTRQAKWQRFPADYQPDAADVALAREHGVDLRRELERLRDHEFKTPHSDAKAVLRNWIRRAADFGAGRTTVRTRGPAPALRSEDFPDDRDDSALIEREAAERSARRI